MFNFFKKKKKVEKSEDPKNLQLIALCLAYEVANIDNQIDEKEKSLLLESIRQNIDTSTLSESEILTLIQQESQDRISFYDLIYDLNHNLTKEEKLTVVELLWQTALADDYLDIEEEKIIKRASDLMGINPSLVLQLKHKALNQS